MYDYFQPLELPPDKFTGQFILTKKENRLPEGWAKYNNKDWYLGVLQLPVLSIETGAGTEVGWCIGYPINHKQPWSEKIVIQSAIDDFLDMAAFDEFYENTGGRFIIFYLGEFVEKVFLDPYGSLSAVYSTIEQTVASTPRYFGESHAWDNEIIDALQMPEHSFYFPMGLTSRQNVKRLLPNHFLNLKDWEVHRHWPKSSEELMVYDHQKEGVTEIISSMKKTIEIIAQRHPIQIALTAGRDSRNILACSKELLNKITFITYAEKKETIDTYISSLLAKRFNLNHKIIPYQEATPKELHKWLEITGHCVSGPIWKTHKSLYEMDPKRVLLNGMAVEIGQAFFWRQGDRIGQSVTENDIIERCGYRNNKRIIEEIVLWLAELHGYNIFNIMDLAYIEQRLACCFAPQHYGNQISLFEIAPYNQRSIIRSTIRLPYAYRWRLQLANDICGNLWPELLELPFNEFIGFKNHIHKSINYLKKQQKDSVRSTKKFVKNIFN